MDTAAAAAAAAAHLADRAPPNKQIIHSLIDSGKVARPRALSSAGFILIPVNIS